MYTIDAGLLILLSLFFLNHILHDRYFTAREICDVAILMITCSYDEIKDSHKVSMKIIIKFASNLINVTMIMDVEQNQKNIQLFQRHLICRYLHTFIINDYIFPSEELVCAFRIEAAQHTAVKSRRLII